MLDRADTSAVRHTNRQRHPHLSCCAAVQLRNLSDDLIEAGINEAVELNFAHRAVAAERKPHRHADDSCLGERGIDHALRAEVTLQAIGDAKNATQSSDVFTKQDNFVVIAEGTAQSRAKSFRQSEFSHFSNPSR